MNELKDKARKNIDAAADAAKRAADTIVDKSKHVAHSAGKNLEKQGKKLQNV
jgi:hypothetical protein